jgi:sugar-phosphatase
VVEEMLARQAADTSGVVAVPGAATALTALPSSRWAVVTSADRRLAESRLRVAGLLVPQQLVTAELTPVGKPSAEPYLYAARLLGARPDECLVVEDSVAGVRSGRAAGCRVLGLRTSVDALDDVDWLVSDLTSVDFVGDDVGVSMRLRSG